MVATEFRLARYLEVQLLALVVAVAVAKTQTLEPGEQAVVVMVDPFIQMVATQVQPITVVAAEVLELTGRLLMGGTDLLGL